MGSDENAMGKDSGVLETTEDALREDQRYLMCGRSACARDEHIEQLYLIISLDAQQVRLRLRVCVREREVLRSRK